MHTVNRNINPVEIWGGAECTLVRVNENIYDQLARSGHEDRTDDLNLFSDLNIGTIRYPLLWEKYVADEKAFFKTNDIRLSKLQELNINPIAGLLHHGSGPFFTNLYEPDFPELLAEFAFTIAQRYPWIRDYTPVNEPLTTARFSGLYGTWYPHKRDDKSFVRILLNELKGIIESMKAVRSINPGARLIQTEDICRVYSTTQLRYQAEFENHRRWLTYDLLLGKVDNQHPMWNYFTSNGIDELELEFFMNNTITPYICGFNYYVTSDRYLDHRKSLYPERYHGGNGKHEYADVEALRANIPISINSGDLLKEAWKRYHMPLALTEVHLACTREEQLRWFNDAYQTGLKLRAEGVDFRAVTAWSFFGSYDWDSLMLENTNKYESGVYDVRSGLPRATALARLIRSINTDNNNFSNLLIMPGWWKRSNRHIYKHEGENKIILDHANDRINNASPLLIIGANGSLGSAFAKICETRGIGYYISERSQLDIASEESVKNVLESLKPWAVINAAGFTRIDDAEKSSLECFRENTLGPGILAEACKQLKIRLVTFSTDQVFNGKKGKPYIESDNTQPLNFYGFSKKLAEENVLKKNPESLIFRSSFFFNPWNKDDSLAKILQSGLLYDKPYYLASDIIISPAYVPDVVNTALDLLIDGESGIWHLSNQEEISYFEFARMVLNLAELDNSFVYSVSAASQKNLATRPLYSVLKSSFGITLPVLSSAIICFLDELYREQSFQAINQLSL